LLKLPLPLLVGLHFVGFGLIGNAIQETILAAVQVIHECVHPLQFAHLAVTRPLFNQSQEVLKGHRTKHAVPVLFEPTLLQEFPLLLIAHHLAHLVQGLNNQLSADTVLHFSVNFDEHLAKTLSGGLA
jgi:hypothetical protein